MARCSGFSRSRKRWRCSKSSASRTTTSASRVEERDMMRITRGGGDGRLFVSSAIFVIALGAAAATAPAQHGTAPAMAVSHPLSLDAQNRLVAEHCAGCHDDEVKTGGPTPQQFRSGP